MAVPVAAGTYDWSGTAIPTRFSLKLARSLYRPLLLAFITNLQWEADIKPGGGNQIQIRRLPEPTINSTYDGSPYIKGGGLGTKSDLSITNTVMDIDQTLDFNFDQFEVDDVQKDVFRGDQIATHFGRRLREKLDEAIVNYIPTAAHADNVGLTAGARSHSYNVGVAGTPVSMTADNATAIIGRCSAILGEQNVKPEDKPYLVLPWVAQHVAASSRLSRADWMGDKTSQLRREMGFLYNVHGLDIYVSNALTPVTDGANTCFSCPFGTRYATAFARQLDSLKRVDLQDEYGERIKSLTLYGRKVVNDFEIGSLYLTVGDDIATI